jgi:hypothetical protein
MFGAVAAGALTMAGGNLAAAAPGATAAPGGVAVERELLCELRPEKIRGLRGSGPAAASPESLRDAVWLLDERIEEWRSGAEGVPQAEALIRRATEVAATWREALAAHESGQEEMSRAALARAAGQLTSLEAQLRQSPIQGCK